MPDTLNLLHAQAMREHARGSALLYREDVNWQPTPDWRLDRQVIRLALALRERVGVEPGQRIAQLKVGVGDAAHDLEAPQLVRLEAARRADRLAELGEAAHGGE